MSKADGKCDCAAHSEAECVCGVWAESKCSGCEYKRRAWHAESQLEIRYGLRREIAAALNTSDATGDEALRQGLEAIARLKARAARWKAAAKRIGKRQAEEHAELRSYRIAEQIWEDA